MDGLDELYSNWMDLMTFFKKKKIVDCNRLMNLFDPSIRIQIHIHPIQSNPIHPFCHYANTKLKNQKTVESYICRRQSIDATKSW